MVCEQLMTHLHREDRTTLNTLTDSIRNNFNERYDEVSV